MVCMNCGDMLERSSTLKMTGVQPEYRPTVAFHDSVQMRMSELFGDRLLPDCWMDWPQFVD